MRSNIKPQFINEWKFNPLPSTDTRTNVVVLRKRKMKLLSCTKKEEEVPPPTIDREDGRIRRTVTNHSNSASSNGFPNCYCFSCFHILFDRDPSTNLTHTLLYLSFWQHPSKAFGASTTKAIEPTAKRWYCVLYLANIHKSTTNHQRHPLHKDMCRRTEEEGKVNLSSSSRRSEQRFLVFLLFWNSHSMDGWLNWNAAVRFISLCCYLCQKESVLLRHHPLYWRRVWQLMWNEIIVHVSCFNWSSKMRGQVELVGVSCFATILQAKEQQPASHPPQVDDGWEELSTKRLGSTCIEFKR